MEHSSLSLLLALLLSCAATLALKTGPITLLKGGDFPPLLRRWLDYVPVAVMAALVGPDIFIFEGKLDLSSSNLFLIVSIPTFFTAWLSKNYFVTIAVGIALVIMGRYFEFA